MSKQPGLFQTPKNLVVNTLLNVDKTLNSGLSATSKGFQMIDSAMGEAANDISGELVTSRVNLAKGNAQHRKELTALGYDEDTIDTILSVEMH